MSKTIYLAYTILKSPLSWHSIKKLFRKAATLKDSEKEAESSGLHISAIKSSPASSHFIKWQR